MSSTSLLIIGIFVVVGIVVAAVSLRGTMTKRSSISSSLPTTQPPPAQRTSMSLPIPYRIDSGVPSPGFTPSGLVIQGTMRPSTERMQSVRNAPPEIVAGRPISPSISPVVITPGMIRSSGPMPTQSEVGQQTMDIGAIADSHPPEWGIEIDCPPVWIKRSQKICILCRDSIRTSYSKTGWARCRQTEKLVHGHCYIGGIGGRGSSPNWCAICNGTCQSNQPMEIIGRQL